MTKRTLVAGVDSSTQSCKVELFDAATGHHVASGSSPHTPAHPPQSEQNPDAWWTAFVAAFTAARKAAAAQPDEIAAISVAAQCHGLVVLDAQDQVIRPAKLWNDTTSTQELARLLNRIGAAEFVHQVGTLPTAAFTISKIAWLAENEPESFAATRSMLLPHDYLTFRLTGNKVTDRSDASGTGYFNAATNAYIPEFLELIDADRDWLLQLPTVLGPEDMAGSVQTGVLETLGLTGTVVVGAGGGDQHASALGLGITEGDVIYSFGTSGVVMALHPTAIHDLTGTVDGVADMTNGFLPITSTLNAAKVTDTFARILGVDHGRLSELALEADTTASGPVLAAYLDGERTPNRPGAVGLLGNLTTKTGPADVARAAYEGVILGLVAGQRALEECGVNTAGSVIAIGGGSRSKAYPQLLSDILGRDVETTDVSEAVARGAAVQAAAVLHGTTVADTRTAWKPARTTVATPRITARNSRTDYETLAGFTGLDRT
jgi:xylulokinase